MVEITRVGLEDILERRGETDTARLEALTDDDIERAVAEDPDAAPLLDKEWFETAERIMPPAKTPVSLRLDRDVLEWFKAQGKGYQSRINAVLRAYMIGKNRSSRAA